MTNIDIKQNFAPVRDAVLKAVAELKVQQDEIVSQVQAESAKARKAAVEGLDKAAKAHRANVDASTKAAKAAVNGLTKAGDLAQAHANGLYADRVAGIEKLLAAGSIAEAVALQLELVKAEQEKQVALAEQFGKLVQDVANDVLKPIQAQAEANWKVAADLKVA